MADDVVEPIDPNWPPEDIPDNDIIYMRVHRQKFNPDGTVQPGAFQNKGDGMSTDWAKYAAPEDTQRRGRVPRDNGVVSMVVGRVRQIPGQTVVHTPIWSPKPEECNQSHTDVYGDKKKDPETRVLFRRLCRIVIPLPPLETETIDQFPSF